MYFNTYMIVHVDVQHNRNLCLSKNKLLERVILVNLLLKSDLVNSYHFFSPCERAGKTSKFYIGDFVPCAIEHAQIETKGRLYIGNFFIEPPIANINSSPINPLVRYYIVLHGTYHMVLHGTVIHSHISHVLSCMSYLYHIL